jgi:cytochrome c oxidase assembly protein subunit 15
LSEADWRDAFEKYKQIPEYRLINEGMSLAAFKGIYWWEWAHRFLGRAIGLIFLLPFLFFWAKGYFARGVPQKLGLIFLLGGAQGALGWYMVMSGLVNRVDVSQYRLAAHLGLALLLYAATLWFAFSLKPAGGRVALPPARLAAGERFPWAAALLLALIYLQILLGAFVAGLDAGKGYNTWPLMDGHLIPHGLGVMSPWYANLFENAMTVQFDHRMLAYGVVCSALLYAWVVRRSRAPRAVKFSAMAVLGVALGQAALGIFTLLLAVPIKLGIAHQAGAVILLSAALLHLRIALTARQETAKA